MQVTNGIPATQLPMARWRKSQASNPSGCCIEVAELPEGAIAVRNSRDPAGPALVYTRPEVAAFLTGVKNGEFDDLYPGGGVVLSPEGTAVDSGLQRPGQRGYRSRHPPAGDMVARDCLRLAGHMGMANFAVCQRLLGGYGGPGHRPRCPYRLRRQ